MTRCSDFVAAVSTDLVGSAATKFESEVCGSCWFGCGRFCCHKIIWPGAAAVVAMGDRGGGGDG